ITSMFIHLIIFFFNATASTEIYTLSLHDALPISRQMTTSTTSIDIMGLQAAYANLHTDQERDYFMQRYHDVISSFGERFSRNAEIGRAVQQEAETDLVCRLLLEKKKNKNKRSERL